MQAKGDGQKHPSEDQSEDSPETSISEQLYFYPSSVNYAQKNGTQAFLKMKMVSDHYKKPLLCNADTVVKETLSAAYLQVTLPEFILEPWWHFHWRRAI